MLIEIEYLYSPEFNITMDFTEEMKEYKITQDTILSLLRSGANRLYRNFTINPNDDVIKLSVYDLVTVYTAITKECFTWQ